MRTVFHHTFSQNLGHDPACHPAAGSHVPLILDAGNFYTVCQTPSDAARRIHCVYICMINNPVLLRTRQIGKDLPGDAADKVSPVNGHVLRNCHVCQAAALITSQQAAYRLSHAQESHIAAYRTIFYFIRIRTSVRLFLYPVDRRNAADIPPCADHSAFSFRLCLHCAADDRTFIACRNAAQITAAADLPFQPAVLDPPVICIQADNAAVIIFIAHCGRLALPDHSQVHFRDTARIGSHSLHVAGTAVAAGYDLRFRRDKSDDAARKGKRILFFHAVFLIGCSADKIVSHAACRRHPHFIIDILKTQPRVPAVAANHAARKNRRFHRSKPAFAKSSLIFKLKSG